MKTINVNRRAETLTKTFGIEKEVEEYEASSIDTVLVRQTSQTLDDQVDVVDVKVEEEVKDEAINFVVEDEIAEVNIEETNFVIRDEKDEVMKEFIEEIKERDNSRVEIVTLESCKFLFCPCVI